MTMEPFKTAEDFIPHMTALPPDEPVRLVRLILQQPAISDAIKYTLMPPGENEFSSDQDLLAWDADGWEEFY